MDLDLTTPHGRVRCVFARTPFQDLPRTPRLHLSPKDFGLKGKVHFAPSDETTSVAEDKSAGSKAAGSKDEEKGSAESEATGSEDGEENSAESEEDGSENSDEAASLILGELDVVSSPTGQSEPPEPAPQPVQRPSPQAKEPHLTPADDDTSTIFAVGDVVSPVTGKSALQKESSTPTLDQSQQPALGGQSSTQNSEAPPSNTLTPDCHKEALLPSVGGPLTPRPSISGIFDSFNVTKGLSSSTSASLSSKGAFSELTQRFDDTPMTELEQSSYLDITKKRKADLSFASPTGKRALHSPKDGGSVYSQEEITQMHVPDADQLPDKKDVTGGEVGPDDADASVSAQPEPSPVIVDVGHGEGQGASSMIATLNAPCQWLSGAVMSHFLAIITSMTPTHALVDIPSDEILVDRHKADFAQAILRGETVGPRKFLAAVDRQNHWVLVELEHVFGEPTELDSNTTAVMNLRIYDSMSNPAVSRDVTQTIQQLVPTGTKVQAKQPQCPQQSDGNSCGVFALVFSVFVVSKTPMPATLDIGHWRLVLRAWAQASSLVSLLPENVLQVTHRRDVDPAVASPRFTEATNETPDKLAIYRVADVSRLLRLTETLVEGNLEWYQTQQDHAAHVLEWVVTEAMPILSTLTASAVREEKWLRQEEANLTNDIGQMKTIIEALGTMKGALPVRDLWACANNGRLSEAERRLVQLRRRLEMCRSGTAPLEKLALPQLEQNSGRQLTNIRSWCAATKRCLGVASSRVRTRSPEGHHTSRVVSVLSLPLLSLTDAYSVQCLLSSGNWQIGLKVRHVCFSSNSSKVELEC